MIDCRRLFLCFALTICATQFGTCDDGKVARKFVEQNCLDCHASDDPTAGIDLSKLPFEHVAARAEVWEKVVRKLRARQMPPADYGHPEESEFIAALESVESVLAQQAQENPQPGRTDTLRRLTRYEYQNAIRDLLSINVDATALLPADEVSHGFDNITVGELSPTLLSRYVTAAQKISRLAVGRPSKSPGGRTIRVKPDVTQEEHVSGLPLGTRGGVLFEHNFPESGIYEFRIRLCRDRDEHVEGLKESHDLELLIDLESKKGFTVRPPGGKPTEGWEKPTHENVDRHLVVRLPIEAGPHDVGVTFLKKPSSLLESKRQPLNVHYNMYRHPRLSPAIFQVSVTGPYRNSDVEPDVVDKSASKQTEQQDVSRAKDLTPSRSKIFVAYPSSEANHRECAEEIMAHLLRRACRQNITADDLEGPLRLFEQASQSGGFEAGIEMALSSVLIHPKFLFRVEQQPTSATAGEAYQISDLELASRLSFFLWSSIPDEELLDAAENGRLRDPKVLRSHVERMLADPRSQSLVSNFAGQWLYLKNLDSITPDGRLYPDFGENLRQAFKRETELLFECVMREDRSVLDLIDSDFTFLNERLAKHYGIPHVYGSRFRRVDLPSDSKRGGLLRHGSVLTVTSYATRTSPVIRGKWIMENLIGTPPPPPPPDVPALDENVVSAKLPVRERLAQHRADPACASCHNLIDPAGFALENFDAVGRWRDLDSGRAVDSLGGLPDGTEFSGVEGLEKGLIERPQPFVGTMSEKLMTYALGRGLEHYDGPAIRKIVNDAEAENYCFSSLVWGIVSSTPFQMRMAE